MSGWRIISSGCDNEWVENHAETESGLMQCLLQCSKAPGMETNSLLDKSGKEACNISTPSPLVFFEFQTQNFFDHFNPRQLNLVTTKHDLLPASSLSPFVKIVWEIFLMTVGFRQFYCKMSVSFFQHFGTPMEALHLTRLSSCTFLHPLNNSYTHS